MLPTLSGFALFIGLASIPFGMWLLRTSRLPRWMKGVWKWPLGDNVTPTVVRLQGWACVLVGAASLVASVLVLLPYLAVVYSGMVAMFLAGASSFPWAWSVALSRTRDEREPTGSLS